MKIAVVGAGKMSKGVIFDLLKNGQLQRIELIDAVEENLLKMKNEFNDPRIFTHLFSAKDIASLRPIFIRCDGVLSAVPYDFNFQLTKLAIESKTHFVDLGGNNDVVFRQFQLNEEAKKARIGVMPDCGLAPGMVSVLSAYLMDQFATVDSLKIRVGGLPVNPKPPLNYQLLFSVRGLINEYIEPAQVLENGQVKLVSSMTEVETIDFPKPFGNLEAFYTSGGCSTLPDTYKGRVTNLDYKTIRYPGHCHIIKAMIDLGFCSGKLYPYKNTELSNREIFEHILQQSLPNEGDDVALVRISVKGKKAGALKRMTLEAIEYGSKEHQLSAMMRTTAFPAAITLQMLVENKITQNGVLRQETAVPGELFLDELEKKGIRFHFKIE
jgi:lysine 6-dehydrogenase